MMHLKMKEEEEARDCQGHGTHCAGLAVGRLTGVAYDANVYRLNIVESTISVNT